MTMKPLLSKWFPNLTMPGTENDEQHHQGAMGPPTGRVPTIGSGPSRPILTEQQLDCMFLEPGDSTEEEKNSSKQALYNVKPGHICDSSAHDVFLS